MKHYSLLVVLCLFAALTARAADDTRPADDSGLPAPRLKLQETQDQASGTTIRHGTFSVWENRARKSGRILELDVVVLPATGKDPRPDPIFYFAGGPGQNAASHHRVWVNHWMRGQRDIVLVSQRGTGGNNRLTFELPGDDDDLQGYLDPIFLEEPFRAGLEKLRQRFDLRQYSTFTAADDVNDLRQELGYDKINLYGGSYGSRAELVYIRCHPETVRTALINSVAPIAFKNPLYHARGAQDALELIFDECDADPATHAAFGDLRAKFATVLERLAHAPADATVRHPGTGKSQRVKLSREAFGEALRVVMYYNSREVPLMIERAYGGDFDLLTQRGLEVNRALRESLAFGMLLCVTSAEDVARITEEEIVRETAHTFIGDGRVRRQRAICSFWPKSELPADFGEPVRSNVPVLIFSGTLDPVTPPRFGEDAVKHLKNGLHVIVPGSHGVRGQCVERIMRDFLDRGTPAGVDTSCVKQLRLPPFELGEKTTSAPAPEQSP